MKALLFVAVAVAVVAGGATSVARQVKDNRERLWWSAYAADHQCVEGRFMLCYKKPASPSSKRKVYWWPATEGATVTLHDEGLTAIQFMPPATLASSSTARLRPLSRLPRRNAKALKRASGRSDRVALFPMP